MKIAIITMEDPLYTTGFMEAIIRDRHKDIVGLTIAKGNRLKIDPKRSKTTYLFSLLLIMGIPSFTWYVIHTLWYKVRKRIPLLGSPSLENFARQYDIPVDYTDNPN